MAGPALAGSSTELLAGGRLSGQQAPGFWAQKLWNCLADPPAPPVLDAPVVLPVVVPEWEVVVVPDPDDGEAPPVWALEPPLAVLPVLPVVLPVAPPPPVPPVELPPVVEEGFPPEDEVELAAELDPEVSVDVFDVVSVEVLEVVSVGVDAVVSVDPLAALAAPPSEAAPLGVVTSGTVRGIASDTCVPPQAPRTTPLSRAPSSAAGRAATRRATSFRADPCAAGRSGSR